MSSCTNNMVQPKSGRQHFARVPHLVCRCPHHAKTSQASNGQPQDQCSGIGHECTTWPHSRQQSMDIDLIRLNENIDGESLDSHDWMELVARGTAWNRGLDESLFPMILDLSAYHGPDLRSDDKAAVTSEDQSEMSFSDSLDGMEDDETTPNDETSWQESSSTSSIEDQYDYQIAIG